MTDNEIIKALNCCQRNSHYVKCNSDCPLYEYCESDEEDKMNICGLALDLIDRQKAEIESLKEAFSIKFDDLATEYDSKMKSEAIKEFVQRLKERKFAAHVWVVAVEDIDNLVKEITEGKRK